MVRWMGSIEMETIMKMTFDRIGKRLPVLALASGLAVAATTLAFTNKTSAKDKPERESVNVPLDESAVPRDSLPRGSYAPIVKKVAPGVVKIETTTTIKNTTMQEGNGFEDPFWRRFFGDQFGRMFPQPPSG